MSFPRAKLQRFNEITNCSPSPADYNPKPIQRQRTWSVVSASSTNDRLSDLGSVVSNDSSVFRTPNLIRKKKPSTTSTKPSSIKLFNITDNELLEAKIVECHNKDVYIKDLTEQIEELKVQINDLNRQKIDLETVKSKYDVELSDVKRKQEDDLKNLKRQHSENLNSLRIRLRKRSEEFTNLKEEYSKIKDEQKATLECLLKDLNQMGEEFNVKATEIYNVEISCNENKIKEKEEEIEKITNELKVLERNNAEEINRIKDLHKKEILNVEKEMLKIITQSEKSLDELKSLHESKMNEIEKERIKEINNLKKEHSDLIKSLTNQKLIDLERLENDYQTKRDECEKESEKIVKEFETLWKNRLKEEQEKSNESLKILQEQSEKKIIEIELEKNKFKQEIIDLKYELNDLKSLNLTEEKFKQLQIDYEKELDLLKTKCDDLEKEKLKLEQELNQCVNTSHSYQITLEKTRETVNAISKRLLNSDRDVENLKREVEIRERKCLNLEEECNRCQDKIEGLIKINNDLEENQERFLTIYNERIETIKFECESKINQYKNLIDETQRKNNDFLLEKLKCLKENKEALDLQNGLNKNAQSVIRNLNGKINDLESINNRLKEEDDRLNVELNEKKDIVETIRIENEKLDEKLNESIEKNEILKNECLLKNGNKEEIKKLKEEVILLQEKCENLQNYSEYYKSKVEEYEKEIQDGEIIEKNYKEQGKKYQDLQTRFEHLQEENNKQNEKIKEYDNLIGPYREQLEAFEEERKHLMSEKTDAELKAVQISSKYAEILGHQNLKQKIKHVKDLKAKIECLEKANKDLEAKLRKQAKTIEQLKRGQAKSPKHFDKENNLYINPVLRDKN